MMAETAKKPAAKSKKVETINPYHLWAARFWHGMLFGPWVRLVARNRFRISFTRLPLAFTITCASVLNSLLRPVQEFFYWRYGTTLLHELLVLDERYTFPTTYECYAPNHFLISDWVITKFKFLLPEKR